MIDNNIQLRELFDLAYGYGICYGEVQVLACREYGKRLEKFDLQELDDFRLWIKRNWEQKNEVLNAGEKP